MANGTFSEVNQSNVDRWAALALSSKNKNTLSLAQQLLGISSTVGTVPQGGKVAGDGNTESPFGRLIDVLTTPLAGVAGLASGLTDSINNVTHGKGDLGDLVEPIKQAGQGIAGNLYSAATGDPNIEGKENFRKVHQQIFDQKAADDLGISIEEYNQRYEPVDMPDWAKYTTFGANVALDPLMYLPGGGIVKGASRGIKTAEKFAIADVPTGAKAIEAAKTVELPKPQLAIGAGSDAQRLEVNNLKPGFEDSGQGTLFGKESAGNPDYLGNILAKREKVGAPETPIGPQTKEDYFSLPDNGAPDQSALFNFNPNPKAEGLVPNIAAYPGKVKAKAPEVAAPVIPKATKAEKLSTDVAEALAPVMAKVGVPIEKIANVLDSGKVAALNDIPVFNEVVSAAPVAKAVAGGDRGKAVNAATIEVLTKDLGFNPKDTGFGTLKVPVEFADGSVKPINAVAIGKALANNSVDALGLKGARFMNDKGKFVGIETLAAKVQTLADKAAGATGAVPEGTGAVTKREVNQAFIAAAKEAGLTPSQIKRVLEAKDSKKAIEKLVQASKAKESSTAKSAVDAGVDPAVSAAKTEAPAVVDKPIPEQLAEGAVKAEEQTVTANAVFDEIAGSAPKFLEDTVAILKKTVPEIAADIRSRPTAEVAKKQLESIGVVHSVPNPAGVSRTNPLWQKRLFARLIEAASKPSKLNPVKKGVKLTTEGLTYRAGLAYKGLQASEEALVGMGHPPLMFHGKDSAFRLSEFLAAVAKDVDTTVEDLIIRLGWVKPYGPGVAAADKELSDLVTAALTMGNNKGFDVMETSFPAVKEYMANGATIQAAIDAKVIKQVGAEVSDTFSMIEKGLTSDAENLKIATHDVPVVTNDLVARSGGSSSAASVINDDAAKEILGVPDNPAPAAVDSVSSRTYVKTAKGDPTVDHHARVFEQIDEGLYYTTKEQKIEGTWQRIMSAMAAWHGYKDLYHLQVNKVQGAQAISNLWLHVYAKTVKKLGLTKDSLANTWKLIRGEGAATAQEAQAVAFFEQRIQNVMRGVDVANTYRVGTSVTTRAGITMDELNRYVREAGIDFQFFKPDKTADAGAWMDSWKSYNGTLDPLEFSMKLESAMTKAVARKATFADLHYNFHQADGVRLDPKLFPELANSRFAPEIADQIPVLYRKLDEMMSPSGKFGDAVDAFLSSWKTGVTIYNPSHHIRNLNGDLFFAWLAGVPVGNPALIAKMTKTMRAQREFYKDISPDMSTTDMLLEMLKGNVAERNILNRASDPSDVISRIQGKHGKTVTISAHDYWMGAFERGVIKHSALIEDIPTRSILERISARTDSKAVKRVIAPTGGKAQKFARGVSETREHGVRLLHFIDKAEKATKRNLARGMSNERALKLAFDEAAESVTKWHPDGTNMTGFERNFMRRMFPFYSWTRKAIPLMMESMLTNPAKMTLYPKIMHDAFGVDGQQDLANPWPTDQVFPRWLREMPVGPAFGAPGVDYTIAQLPGGNPFMDMGNQFVNDPKAGVASMVNPLARIPAEVATGTDSQTGAPIKEWGTYANKQIPPIALINRLVNTDIGFGSVGSVAAGGSAIPLNNTGRATDDYVNNNAIMNWLFATGLINASQPNYLRQAQYEERDRAAKAAKARKEALANG